MELKDILYLLVYIVVMILGVFTFAKRKRSTKYRLPKEILNNYLKSPVDVSTMEILSNSYYEEVEKDIGSIRSPVITDSLYDPTRNVSIQQSYTSVLVIRDFFIKGQSYKLKSQPIHLSKKILQSKISNIQKIDVYLDPTNPAFHYFDLSFLNE